MLLRYINWAFIFAISSNEEGSFCIIALKQVENMVSKSLFRAVVISECDSSWCDTFKDTRTTVCKGAKLGAWKRRSVGTTGSLVLGAAWAILVLASGRFTEVGRRTTNYTVSVYYQFS